MRFRMPFWITAALACLLASGCGPRLPETSPVSGRITVGGQLVTAGRIVFLPDNGRPAIGAIENDGTYRLTTCQRNDGAVLGRHCVTIEAFEAPPADKPARFEDELAGKTVQGNTVGKLIHRWIVPEKYAQRSSSPLTADVKPGVNAIDFNLP